MDECAICLEPLAGDPGDRLCAGCCAGGCTPPSFRQDCRHACHRDCMERWILTERRAGRPATCPVCRAELRRTAFGALDGVQAVVFAGMLFSAGSVVALALSRSATAARVRGGGDALRPGHDRRLRRPRAPRGSAA